MWLPVSDPGIRAGRPDGAEPGKLFNQFHSLGIEIHNFCGTFFTRRHDTNLKKITQQPVLIYIYHYLIFLANYLLALGKVIILKEAF